MTQIARICIAALLFAALAGGATAQEAPKKRVIRPMESYPLHLRGPLESHRATMLPGNAAKDLELQGVYYRSKLWAPGQVLNVCFFEGPEELRSRIARIAKRWEKVANLKLDFGNTANPRLCGLDEVVNEIRVGFEYAGYWSLVGQESMIFAKQSEQSMNFESFHLRPPPEPEFTGYVLHEFGHAIGLQHEHQNPKSTCEEEFDWEVVYAELALPPNNWDRAKVDFNMRRLLNDGDIQTVGKFDKASIMLYTFDDWMYKKGKESNCFFYPNYEISLTDSETVATMYPGDKDLVAARRERDIKKMSSGTSGLARERALKSLEALHSSRDIAYKRDAIQQLSVPGLR